MWCFDKILVTKLVENLKIYYVSDSMVTLGRDQIQFVLKKKVLIEISINKGLKVISIFVFLFSNFVLYINFSSYFWVHLNQTNWKSDSGLNMFDNFGRFVIEQRLSCFVLSCDINWYLKKNFFLDKYLDVSYF